jgi:hypothetical protein
MTPQDRSDGARARDEQAATGKADRAQRKALVEEMVRGAILPGLLARKDDGAFDRGPNVVRFPAGNEA